MTGGAYSYPTGEPPRVDNYTITSDGASPPVITATGPASSGVVIIGEAIDAPQDLQVPTQAGQTVPLTWSDPPAGDVEVWRRAGTTGTYALIATVANGVGTYTDPAPGAGLWYYRLRASSGDARSEWSAAQSLTVVAVPVLTCVPTSGAGPLVVGCSWTAPPEATSFRIRASNNSDLSAPLWTVTQAGTSIDTPAINGPTTIYIGVNVAAPSVGITGNVVTITVT